MKFASLSSLASIVCLCFLFLSLVDAQSGDPNTPLSLPNAVAELQRAKEDQNIPLSPQLAKKVEAFLRAAKTPSNREELESKTKDLEAALGTEKRKAGFRSGKKVEAIETAVLAARQVLNGNYTNSATPSSSVSPSGSPAASGTAPGDDQGINLLGLLLQIGVAIAAVALVVGLIFAGLHLRRTHWAKFDDHVNELVKAHVTGVKRRQDDLSKQLTAAADEQRKASGRLESIEAELKALGRRTRQNNDGGYQGASVRQAFDQYSRLTPEPVEPDFPASVIDYLDKKKRNSTVVRPDFQNGILISDLDGKGELVLIRDASIPDDAQPLFLVPRVPQFQTKQEFHSYYERYYDCQRPSAGDVWIIDPAIVSTVPGGWELREKGVLEVR
jgi:uncharacterized protein YoxC